MARRRPPQPDGVAFGAGRLIAYYRVSTEQQGRSGLGLEAQREAVSRYAASAGAVLVAEYQEVESGKRVDRPQLTAALSAARAKRATLVIAKLDRLSRNARFLLSVVEGTGEGGVVFCDLPQLPAGAMGKFFVTLMAAVAELEAGLISQRTRAALEAAKARGVRLGSPMLRRGDSEAARLGREAQTDRSSEHAADVAPFIAAARRAGATSLQDFADALMARGVRTPRGGEVWTKTQVKRVLSRTSAYQDTV